MTDRIKSVTYEAEVVLTGQDRELVSLNFYRSGVEEPVFSYQATPDEALRLGARLVSGADYAEMDFVKEDDTNPFAGTVWDSLSKI